MATGYIRNDTANNIATGNTINASDLDGEFDAIQSAMDATTGHNHDGTVGGGAPIAAIGPVQDVVITTSVMRPKTDNTVDLGTSSLEFKDLYLDGTANIDTLQVDESATITANLTVNGNTTLGNAATDTVTVTADVASNLIPSADNTYNLGSATDEWANIYIDGTAQVDTLQVDESATITADLTVNGNTTLGNADTDTVTVNADFASSLIPDVDNTYDLGLSTNEWRNLYIDGTAQVDTLQVDESATIAANLTVTGNATITTNLTVNGNTTIGNADTDTVTVTADVASNLIPSADNTYDLGATGSEWKDLYITGTANIDSLVADTAAISAGTATLSAATVITATGGIVTLQRDDSAITSGETLGQVDFQAPNVAGGGDAILVTATIKAVADDTFSSTVNKTSLLFQTAVDGAVATRMEITGNGHVLPGADDVYDLGASGTQWRDLYIDGTANIDSLVADTADINGGTIDGATIATSDITVGAGKTLNVSAGTLTLANDQISGDKVEGGTINDITINTLGSTTVDTTNIEVTNLKAKDGTAAGSIANSTGVVTLASSVLTTTDINGGTIDAATIGATTAAAGTFTSVTAPSVTITGGTINGTSIGATTTSSIAGTTGTFSGNLTVDTNTLFVNATDNRVGVGTTNPLSPLQVNGTNGEVLRISTTGDAATQQVFGLGFATAPSNTHPAAAIYAEELDASDARAAIVFYTRGSNSDTAPDERMRIDSAGIVMVGTTDTSPTTNNVAGVAMNSGTFSANCEATFHRIGRRQDGTILAFYSAGDTEGNISISGASTTLTPFLGSHWSALSDWSRPEIKIGTIIETINELVDWKYVTIEVNGNQKKVAYNGTAVVGSTVTVEFEDYFYDGIVGENVNPLLNKHVKVKVSDTFESKSVYGVFLSWNTDVELDGGVWNDMNVAAVGNYVIRMAAGQTPEIGDLVVSDGTGCGIVQSDDIIRAKTVAKITNTIPQVVYDDGSFLVTCVIYCG